MGAQVADAVVVNPLSKIAARIPFLPEAAKVIQLHQEKLREISGLPPLEKWKEFSVDSTVPLERILKDLIMQHLILNLHLKIHQKQQMYCLEVKEN